VVEDKPIVVVGSGPSGLMQALYLACVRKKKVVVIEQKSTIGGLFNSLETPWGLVDLGVHVLQETGCKTWDDLFEQVLPSNDWYILEGSTS
jgi:protoporphyrinogen oxidase